MSDKTKKILSEQRKGIPLKESTKEKLKEYYKTHSNPMYGKHHTEETKEKIRNTKLGKKKALESRLNDGRNIKVKCVETDVIYPSISIASEKTSIGATGIIRCCKGKQKTGGEAVAGDHHRGRTSGAGSAGAAFAAIRCRTPLSGGNLPIQRRAELSGCRGAAGDPAFGHSDARTGRYDSGPPYPPAGQRGLHHLCYQHEPIRAQGLRGGCYGIHDQADQFLSALRAHGQGAKKDRARGGQGRRALPRRQFPQGILARALFYRGARSLPHLSHAGGGVPRDRALKDGGGGIGREGLFPLQQQSSHQPALCAGDRRE